MRRTREPTLLLVEDDEMDIMLFERHAKRHKLAQAIDIVKDGEQALSYLKEVRGVDGVPPVVLVTDLNMPGMTGHELIDDIRATPHLANMIIFVISTSDLDSDISRAYANHVAGYIVKDTSGAATETCVQMLSHFCSAVTVSP